MAGSRHQDGKGPITRNPCKERRCAMRLGKGLLCSGVRSFNANQQNQDGRGYAVDRSG